MNGSTVPDGYVHYVLYALLVAVPVSRDRTCTFARGDSLPLFGLTEIVSPWTRDRALARSVKEIHEVTANALVILAAFHAAAAFVHHLGAARSNAFADASLLSSAIVGRSISFENSERRP